MVKIPTEARLQLVERSLAETERLFALERRLLVNAARTKQLHGLNRAIETTRQLIALAREQREGRRRRNVV
jgi:hypothetical protein